MKILGATIKRHLRDHHCHLCKSATLTLLHSRIQLLSNWAASPRREPSIQRPTAPLQVRSPGSSKIHFWAACPRGRLSSDPIGLSLSDAITRGLRYNLGVIENQASLRQAQAQRLRALSAMVPSVSALLRQNLDDLNRVAIGLNIPGLPPATGQFGYQESYLAFSDNGLNLDSLYRYRASKQAAEAQRLQLGRCRQRGGTGRRHRISSGAIK